MFSGHKKKWIKKEHIKGHNDRRIIENPKTFIKIIKCPTWQRQSKLSTLKKIQQSILNSNRENHFSFIAPQTDGRTDKVNHRVASLSGI